MARRVAYRTKKQNKFGMFLVFLVVAMLALVVAVRSAALRTTLTQNQQRITELEAQITDEETRAEKIDAQEKYSHTLGYKEDVAKEKLNLVNEGEIIFRDESH